MLGEEYNSGLLVQMAVQTTFVLGRLLLKLHLCLYWQLKKVSIELIN